ncbi:MAG TPA: cohesin domain-containing protein [Mariniphaga sp.]|nr:cohesin domain-containing protein [Mariniphaga sp.]
MKLLYKRLQLIFIFLISMHCGISASSINSPVLTIESETTTHSSVTISVTACNFSNIRAGDLMIEYDPAIAIVTTIIKKPNLKGTFQFNLSEPGKIKIGWYAYPAVTLDAGTALFDINFERKNHGTSIVSFETTNNYNCQFYNYNFKKLNDNPSHQFYKSGSITFKYKNNTPTLKIESVIHPEGCNGMGKIILYGTDIPDGEYLIYYDGGNFENIKFISGIGTIEASAGTYNNLRLTSNNQPNPTGLNAHLKNPCEPAAPIIQKITQPDCDKALGSITLTGLPNGIWTLFPGNITGNESTIELNNLPSGKYHFYVINEAGCTSGSSKEVIIEGPPAIPTPTIKANGPTHLCSGEEIILTASEASSYCWSTGDTTRSITISAPGSYIVSVHNEHGCTGISEPILISVIDPLKVEVYLKHDTTTVEEGREITITAITNEAVSAIYSWYLNDKLVYKDTNPNMTYLPSNEDEIYVKLNVFDACVIEDEVQSNTIKLKVEGVTSNKYINQISTQIKLLCYPNPFSSTAKLTYSIPLEGVVNISLTGINGLKESLLSNQFLNAGNHELEIFGSRIPPGIYILMLSFNEKDHIKIRKYIKVLKQ